MVCYMCTASKVILTVSVVVLCVECCLTLFDIASPVVAQCCECGIFLNGEYKGITVLDASGFPNIRCCSTHGMCKPCADIKLANWHYLKAQRKAVSSAV